MPFTFKNETQHRILKEIWMKSEFTRQQIGDALNINRSTVSRNIDGLLRDETVKIVGELLPGKKGGRKTNILKLNPESIFTIGISVEQNELIANVLNLEGITIDEYKIHGEIKGQTFFQAIMEAVNHFSCYFDNILAVSIAMPGLVDSLNGIVKLSDALDLVEVPVVDYFENRIPLKFYVENDANAGAAAWHVMSNLEYSSILYFYFSFPFLMSEPVGFGAGLIIDGKLQRGSHHAAGEILHPSLCLHDKSSRMTFSDFMKFGHDDIMISNEEKIHDFITHDIALLISFIDPDMAVLGGNISLLPKGIQHSIISELKKKLPYVKNDEAVTIDQSGDSIIARGASCAFLNRFMNDYEYAARILEMKGENND